ncbi:ABC transporter ATP-binding protein [Natronosalvus halobius]|uniref:ABC transporter ATP-binding protein n=1 Tax=Natronosalvus halobius TaxID=2953746 RepID=UPI00209ECAC7|nr:ABC transporter ATP-binding protein [Natronosalvus halobius]USZ73691.1 ABC transporter ATP-binding protein [Natronosalvus halobius]
MKTFGTEVAVDDVSFEVERGEFFSFLGPSGCGKTTTLRMIAGFEEPTSGSIDINNESQIGRLPHERDVSMVFQNFALFPNKTVGENVAFGLKMEGVSKAKRRERATEYLELVDMGGFEDRKPANLSGGQQQRVALARALITEPSILLLDEPLSSLDLKLRKNMRFELKRIQEELNTTFIYVTHDQEEALSMSDRIMLLNDGQRVQVGSPSELYGEPVNEFAADFIGDTNFFDGRVARTHNGSVDVSIDKLDVTLSNMSNSINAEEGDRVVLSLRPENIELKNGDAPDSIRGEVSAVTFYGKLSRFLVDAGGQEVLVEVAGKENRLRFTEGDTISLHFNTDDATLVEG